MSDLYHIPGDDGKTFRLKKFVEYQHEVPAIDTRFLGEWIKKYHYSKDEATELIFVLSATYNEITTLIIEQMRKDGLSYDDIWGAYKEKLIFGSARRYAKLNDGFIKMMNGWEALTKKQPYLWLKSKEEKQPQETLKAVTAGLKTINGVGRLGADFFVEPLTYLKDYMEYNIGQPQGLDWQNCANLTSGTYNIFYEDERANLYDKTHRVDKSEYEYLNFCLRQIQEEIRKTYPEQDSRVYMFLGKICSFRNLFKGARYGGYHHDRELGYIMEYKEIFPEYDSILEKCFELRKEIFPERFLGELHGWDGIRNWRKKLWLTQGKTGVEIDG